MYSIFVGDTELFYPGDSINTITSGKLKLALNDSGSLDITIPSVNPFYNLIKQRATELTVKQDDRIVWNGEVREISTDFYKNKSIYAVGELAYLNDSVQPLRQYTDATKTQIFTALINEHNSQVEERKQFKIGALGNDAGRFITVVTNYDRTLDFIRNYLCNDDDCLRIRRVGNERYLDIMPIESYGKRSEQLIEFADNLLDYTESTNSTELYTAVIPLGADLDVSPIEDVSNPLTIESINGGKNYVFSDTAVNNYGWIKTVVEFNEIEDPRELKAKGEEWLKANQFEKYSYTLKAVDMSTIDVKIDNYFIGDYVRCLSEPHGMDVWLPVRKREIDLLDISQNKVTLGAEGQKSFTEKTVQQVNELKEQMPEEAAIIKAAKRNASALINANGDGGYIAMRINEEGKPYEFVVMDAPNMEQSSKAWRWNLAGFGYGTKQPGEADFTWDAKLAITMDGQIVADFIKAGTLTGIAINNGNGTFKVDANGNLVATSANIKGTIYAKNGEIGGWSISDDKLDGDEATISLSSDKVIYVGDWEKHPEDMTFAIMKNGDLYCNNIYYHGECEEI